MDLIQLEYFKEVAETGHLTNSAKKLNVAQPALSVSIAKLENEIGVSLFDRVGRGIYLNKCGEIYLEYVIQALSLLKKAQQEVNVYSEKLENVLNLGIVSKPFSQMMLRGFKEKYPNSRIRQVDITSDCIEEELLKNEVDYVITNEPSSFSGIMDEIIHEEKMMLAVPANHPLASRKWIRLSEASQEPFINLPKGYGYRMATDEMCRDAGFAANIAMECFHCQMLEMVADGIGVALMTEERKPKRGRNSQVVFLPLKEPEYTIKYYILWKAGHHFNRIAKEFQKYLKEYSSFGNAEFFECKK